MRKTKFKHSVVLWFQTFIGLAALLAALPTGAATVSVPAGSVDALSAAVASAGPRGTVILQSGLHHETETVTVDIPVSIIGEPDAVVESSASPALHILGTEGAHVEGIAVRSTSSPFGDLAILIQNAPRTTIQGNSIVGFNAGIFIQYANHTVISENHLSNISRHAIISINGRQVRIIGNEIIGSAEADPFPFNGIWLCDVGGECLQNTVSGGWFNGILLCRLAGGPVFPDGSEGIAETSATQWIVANNISFGNDGGIVASDGANLNLIANNTAYNNLSADIILDGEYEDAPPSFENLVTVGSDKDLVIWDYGIDNQVKGAEAIAP